LGSSASSSAGALRPSLRLCVEALGRDLAQHPIPQLDLDEEVVAEAADGVDPQEREPPLLHRALVEHLAVELGRGRDRPANHRQAPDQGDVAAALPLGAPRSDHVVGEVDLPIRVLVGGDVGEIGAGPHLARLALPRALEGDPAEVLEL
jgi:hypothetical protein